ncbi:MAG: maleylpyruvate isomerase N-terminal domain-containing protein [Streptomycetales bacterium]
MTRVIEAHRRLLDLSAALTDDGARAPSTLPGWSRGHVLTHLDGRAQRPRPGSCRRRRPAGTRPVAVVSAPGRRSRTPAAAASPRAKPPSEPACRGLPATRRPGRAPAARRRSASGCRRACARVRGEPAGLPGTGSPASRRGPRSAVRRPAPLTGRRPGPRTAAAAPGRRAAPARGTASSP